MLHLKWNYRCISYPKVFILGPLFLVVFVLFASVDDPASYEPEPSFDPFFICLLLGPSPFQGSLE